MPRRSIVRVLLVEASAPRRLRLQRLLESDPLLQVLEGVGHAEEAIEVASRRQPDVILVGQTTAPAGSVATTRRIMQARATPVVAITAAAAPAQDRQVFDLMEAGALAVVHDPGAGDTAQGRRALARLAETVRLMAEVKVVRRWAPPAARTTPAAPAPSSAPGPRSPAAAGAAVPQPRGGRSRIDLVAIGASTGGPVALKQLLAPLPATFPVPIVIVQHMADGFLPGLAEWLAASCAVRTEVAGPATTLRPGRAYLAPDGMHMRVAPGPALAFDAAAPVNGHRPAVACLLESVAAHYGRHAIGILLTGMGKDGAAELKRMKDAGAITICQDEASSVVHGMPGEAIRCGGAGYIMSPEEIGLALPALATR